jgi:DNA polymerase-3 subunit delta'
LPAILGQSRPLQVLSSALRSGRFHHAWIFSGPRGVGKRTTALQVARVLLDPGVAPDVDLASELKSPQDRIQSLIDSNAHPDLHIIRKELALYSDNRELRERKLLNIPLDLIRERIIGGKTGDDRIHEAPAYRTPLLGHGKVFIIDEAELLAGEAQNALLKTLEEPPPLTWFFLVTSQPDRLLSTIRSRCQHVRFDRLDPVSMREWFQRNPELGTRNSGLLSWVEEFADGSPGIAQLAIEYGFYDWKKTLDPMLVELDRGRFPVAMGATLGELVEQFAQAWVKAHGEKSTSKDAANKDGAKHLFTLLAAHVRATIAAAVDRTDGSMERRLAAADLLHEAERQLDANVNLKLLLENLVVQWAEALAPSMAHRRVST